ncbi:unnamed protein product, partial [Amoebophrya sp. A25]
LKRLAGSYSQGASWSERNVTAEVEKTLSPSPDNGLKRPSLGVKVTRVASNDTRALGSAIFYSGERSEDGTLSWIGSSDAEAADRQAEIAEDVKNQDHGSKLHIVNTSSSKGTASKQGNVVAAHAKAVASSGNKDKRGLSSSPKDAISINKESASG